MTCDGPWSLGDLNSCGQTLDTDNTQGFLALLVLPQLWDSEGVTALLCAHVSSLETHTHGYIPVSQQPHEDSVFDSRLKVCSRRVTGSVRSAVSTQGTLRECRGWDSCLGAVLAKNA